MHARMPYMITSMCAIGSLAHLHAVPLNASQEGEQFDFRGLLHRDGTVFNAVTPEELSQQPEVCACSHWIRVHVLDCATHLVCSWLF